jgi:tetratricopeptide (TPR) repeat protein
MKNSTKIQSQEIIRVCNIAGKFIIYILVFFLPLFFLPFTYDPLDFNKQFFLGILVFVALIFWLIKIFLSDKFEINFSLIDVSILVLILVSLLSLIFSSWRYSSFWGWPFNVSQGFLSLIYFFLAYFLITNYFEKKKEIFNLLFILILSGFFVTILSILNIFGKSIFPWDFSRLAYFNTVGSLVSLALFLSVLFPLAFLGAIVSKGLMRKMFLVSTLSFLFLFFLVNSKLAWLVLTVGSSILFVFGLLNLKKSGETNLVFPPLVFLIISLAFLAFPHPVNFLENTVGFSFPKLLPEVQVPFEVSINPAAEFDLMKGSFKNIKNLFLGSGPSNFIFEYLSYKPLEINSTQFWDTRFQSGASEILDKTVTTGILGLVSLFSVFLIFFFQVGKNLKQFFKNLKQNKEEKTSSEDLDSFDNNDLASRETIFSFCISSSFVSIVFSFFIHPANFSLLFIFWFILAVFGAYIQNKRKKIISSLASAVFLTLVFIIGITISFSLIKNYQAEVKYQTGINYLAKGNIKEAITSLEKASNLNPKLDVYWRDISRVYLSRLDEISQDQTLSKEEISSSSQELVYKSLSAAENATELSPKNSLNWINRGLIYENLINKFPSDTSWISNGLDFYKKASELEPKNPQILTKIGQIYILKFDILSQQEGADQKEKEEDLNRAKENLQQAVELKSDFIQANIQLALVFQREGNIKEAITKLEQTRIIAPYDLVLIYQLGLLYYEDKNYNSAKSELERAIELDKNYSNARYFLGLIYAKEGDKDKAIEQFEWIERLNPEDESVKSILKNIREGNLNF